MKHSSNMHWANDEEALSQYVLNRVDPAERIDMERHLATCETCRKAVLDERRLAAGAKLLGREQLKSRMGRMVELSEPVRIPWPHVVSAAAVLVIVLGVAIYHQWLPTTERSETFVTKDLPATHRKADSSFASPEAGRENVSKESPEAESTPFAASATKGARKTEETRRVISEAPAGAPAEVAELSGRDQDATEARPLEKNEVASVWVVGSVGLREEPVLEEEQMNRNDEMRTFTSESARAKSALGKTLQDRLAQDKTGETFQYQHAQKQSTYHLVQRPVELLPMTRQHLVSPGTVQTLVEPAAGGYQLVLYTDSSFSEEEIRAASISQIDEDSVDVVIGKKRISYRLPAKWIQQTQPVR